MDTDQEDAAHGEPSARRLQTKEEEKAHINSATEESVKSAKPAPPQRQLLHPREGGDVISCDDEDDELEC